MFCIFLFCILVSSPDKLCTHLKQLLGEAELRLQELGGSFLEEAACGAPLNTRASFSSIMGGSYNPASAMTGNFQLNPKEKGFSFFFI